MHIIYLYVSIREITSNSQTRVEVRQYGKNLFNCVLVLEFDSVMDKQYDGVDLSKTPSLRLEDLCNIFFTRNVTDDGIARIFIS